MGVNFKVDFALLQALTGISSPEHQLICVPPATAEQLLYWERVHGRLNLPDWFRKAAAANDADGAISVLDQARTEFASPAEAQIIFDVRDCIFLRPSAEQQEQQQRPVAEGDAELDRDDLLTDWRGQLVLIKGAKSGDTVAAWQLIDLLERFYSERPNDPHAPLLTAFVAKLAQIWNVSFNKAGLTEWPNAVQDDIRTGPPLQTRDLQPALAALGITQGRGRAPRRLDQPQAWLTLALAEAKLRQGTLLERWLSRCLFELLSIHQAGGVKASKLAESLGCLHLVATKGQPKRDEMESTWLLLKERNSRCKGSSAKDARAQLSIDTGEALELRLRDIRTRHPDIARAVDMYDQNELKGLFPKSAE